MFFVFYAKQKIKSTWPNSYVKSVYFSSKTQGNLGNKKLNIGSDPVVVDWHKILFVLVLF